MSTDAERFQIPYAVPGTDVAVRRSGTGDDRRYPGTDSFVPTRLLGRVRYWLLRTARHREINDHPRCGDEAAGERCLCVQAQPYHTGLLQTLDPGTSLLNPRT
eukprot:1786742-Rhodomonas_salina.1